MVLVPLTWIFPEIPAASIPCGEPTTRREPDCAVNIPKPDNISVPKIIVPPVCIVVLPKAFKVPDNVATPVPVTVILL